MFWPRMSHLPPAPPARNPQRAAGVVEYYGASAEERARVAAGLPAQARFPREVIVLDDTPFADCLAATTIVCMAYNHAMQAAEPFLVGFGAGAGRALNLTGWTANMTEAAARALLIVQFNAAAVLWADHRNRWPFRAYEQANWNNSGRTALIVERQWPSIGGGNNYRITGTQPGAGTWAPIRVQGISWLPGAQAAEMIPAIIGKQRAFMPFNVEPRGDDRLTPNGDNTIVIG